MSRTRILAFVDYYLPGYKFGGPGRVLANLVEYLGDEFGFRIVTTDRDFGDMQPYAGALIDSWQEVGKARVCYLPQSAVTLGKLRDLIVATDHDIIYLNSLFSPKFAIKPLILRRLSLIPDVPVIVAPRGELSPGALAIKSAKKGVFLGVAKLSGLYSRVVWQALSMDEVAEIRARFGKHAAVALAKDMVSLAAPNGELCPTRKKRPGKLTVMFLSRISRKKNLLGALRIMQGLRDREAEFHIYGPRVEPDYWEECEQVMRQMPHNIRVQYCGSVRHSRIQSLLVDHDLFFLPTFGEGSATAVLEAFAAGCPVLISTNTPYRNLEQAKAGWDIPLSDPDRFRDPLRLCADMDAETHREWSEGARQYGRAFTDNNLLIEENRQLFLRARGTGE